MSQWKSKVSMPTQMGKASLAFKSSVGVRGLALVGPEVVCPSGEQVTNGGFETGDATGWVLVDGTITTSNPHSGTYCAEIWPSGTRLLSQTFASPILVECISSFDFWRRNSSSAAVRVTYSDGSDTGWIGLSDVTPWTNYDLLPQLTSGKYVSKIEFLNGYVQPLYIDDVSLIGSG